MHSAVYWFRSRAFVVYSWLLQSKLGLPLSTPGAVESSSRAVARRLLGVLRSGRPGAFGAEGLGLRV